MPNPLIIAIKDNDELEINRLLTYQSTIEVNFEAAASEGLIEEEVPAIPLHLASYLGYPRIVQLLLEHGADPNYKSSDYEQTPLELVATRGRFDDNEHAAIKSKIINLLFYAGAKFEEEVFNKSFNNSLELIAQQQAIPFQVNNSIIKALHHQKIFTEFLYFVEKDDYNKANRYLKDTHYLYENYTKSLLCSFKIDPNFDGGYYGIAILYAAHLKEPHMLELLYTHGASLAMANLVGCNVFHYAARSGSVANIKWLINHIDKSKFLNAQDINGNTPLHFATKYGHFSVVNLLLANGADPKILNTQSNTPKDLSKSLSIRKLLDLYLDNMPSLLWLCAQQMAHNQPVFKQSQFLPDELKSIIFMAKHKKLPDELLNNQTNNSKVNQTLFENKRRNSI